ncbi:hypothetical protein [Candidatus Paracaedibacter symbiosus]|uniref:hypothetical protein n=1 Tax=Candidatus Paracaedibacter symbiosus TaxID=244582 RepID=UPI000509D1A9|nr:hypothetical protein [Candidatus Paracaedibacter symbiosus]
MKALRTMFTHNLVLIIGIMALSLKQACAMEKGVFLNENLNPLERKLKGVMRGLIWERSPQPNGEDLKADGPMEITYGYSGGLSENILKSYAALICSVAGADGLTKAEEVYINGQLKLLCADKQGEGISLSVIDGHLAELYEMYKKVEAGELKINIEDNIKSAIQKHVENLMVVGNPPEIISAAARCALYDAIMASSADGDYSNLERKATESAAKVLDISNNELELLQEGCEIETSLNRDREIITNPDFVEKVDAVYEKVNKYYTKK